MSSVKPATTLVFDSFSGNSLVYLIVLFRQKFPLVSVIVVVGLANLSCCCDHCVNVANKPDKKCETKDSSLRNNFVLEPRDQRFPGSLSLALRRAGRRKPWERGWVVCRSLGRSLVSCNCRVVGALVPCQNVLPQREILEITGTTGRGK